MAKGEMPIPYIVAIILGVIVVGILVLWLIISWQKGYGIVDKAYCNAKLLEFCSKWSACAYQDSCKPADTFYSDFARECDVFQPDPDMPKDPIRDTDCSTVLFR